MRVTMLYINLCFTSHCPLCTIQLYTQCLFDGIHLQVLHHLFKEDLLILHLPPPNLQLPHMIFLVCIYCSIPGVSLSSGLGNETWKEGMDYGIWDHECACNVTGAAPSRLSDILYLQDSYLMSKSSIGNMFLHSCMTSQLHSLSSGVQL